METIFTQCLLLCVAGNVILVVYKVGNQSQISVGHHATPRWQPPLCWGSLATPPSAPVCAIFSYKIGPALQFAFCYS